MAVVTRPDDMKTIVADLKRRIATLERVRASTILRLQNAQYSGYSSLSPATWTSVTDGPNLAGQLITVQPNGSYSAIGVVQQFTIVRPTRLMILAVASVKVTSGGGFAYGQGIIRVPGSSSFVGNTPTAVVDGGIAGYQPMFMYSSNPFYMPDGVTHPGDMYQPGTYQCMIQYGVGNSGAQLSIGNQNIDVYSFGD